MNPTTLAALRRAYRQLEDLVEGLYDAMQVALDNDDFLDASLLQSKADKLYEEVENLGTLISELEEQ